MQVFKFHFDTFLTTIAPRLCSYMKWNDKNELVNEVLKYAMIGIMGD